MWANDYLKTFLYSDPLSSALWILEGDNKWGVEEEEEREGNKVLPVKGFVVMRGWGSMKILLFFSIFILC